MSNMSKSFKYAVIVPALALGACASAPEKVSPAYTSPAMYAGLTCNQLKQEDAKLDEAIYDMSRLQRKARRRDTIAWTVGSVVAWPAAFFAIGNNKDAELAKLKGKSQALYTVAEDQDCWYTTARK